MHSMTKRHSVKVLREAGHQQGAVAELTETIVSHVVHAPRGAAPGACLPLYEADWPALLDYTALERPAVAGWARARLEDAT